MATAFAPRPPATMTARVVVMRTPEEKRTLEARAREFEMSASDFVRRASDSYDPRVDEAFFDAFLTQFEANNREMCEMLKDQRSDRCDSRRDDGTTRSTSGTMNVFEWIGGGLRDQLRLSDEVRRVSANADKLMADVFDHEKRLIRIETLIEFTRAEVKPKRLPPE